MKGNRLNRLLNNRKPVKEEFEYMTDELGRKAAEYIRGSKRPFFMYLSFNAVHTPMHAKDGVLEKVTGLQGKRRRILSAMTRSMDDAVGVVLSALKETKKDANTLVFFVNDNGGATSNASRNGKLKGHKGTPFEGGIRVPFLARFPGRIPKGSVYKKPVSTMDIFSTAIAVAGANPPDKPLDGVNLMPFVSKEGLPSAPHKHLFWKQGDNWAVRSGEWKLVYYGGKKKALKLQAPALYNLAKDIGETTDCSEAAPERKKALSSAYKKWSRELTAPKWGRNRLNKQRGDTPK
jgi:arylsulfatase A-like enzyme